MGGIQYYNIFGRQVGSHYLAMATLATAGAGIAWGVSGPKKEGPKIDASSKEEEEFIQEFIRSAEAEDAKTNAAKAKH